LDAATFEKMMDEEGRIRDPAALQTIIFYGVCDLILLYSGVTRY